MKAFLFRTNLQVLILFFGLLAVSCSKDKEEEAVPDTTNQFEYNGKVYTFKSGLVEDFGKGSFFSNTDTHHNHDYTITDGAFTIASGQITGPGSSTALLYVELYSSGITGFNSGTFTFINGTDDENKTAAQLEAKYKNKSYFNNAILVTDSNASKTLDQNDSIVGVTGGTVKVSGSVSAPTLEFDVTLSDGKTLKGTYKGSFLFSDETE